MSEIIMNQETLEPQVPSVLPLLALRDVVVYPYMQIALFAVSYTHLTLPTNREV